MVDSIANHDSSIDYNQKLNRQIIHTWKTIWFPIYGEDFEGFCRFVFKNYNVDISKEFCLTYNYELILKPKIKPSNIPLPPKEKVNENNDALINQKPTPKIELKLKRPRRLSSLKSDSSESQSQKRWQ
jgi:hypothetical protein